MAEIDRRNRFQKDFSLEFRPFPEAVLGGDLVPSGNQAKSMRTTDVAWGFPRIRADLLPTFTGAWARMARDFFSLKL